MNWFLPKLCQRFRKDRLWEIKSSSKLRITNITLDDWRKVMKDNIYFFWKVSEERWRVWIVLWPTSCRKRWMECFKNLVNLTRLVESESHPCSLQMRCSSNDGVMFFCLLFLCFMKVSPCNYIQLIAVPPLHNSTQLSRVKTRFRWVSFPKKHRIK